MKTQSKQPRYLMIRKGKVFWEWRYREELPSSYRTTKIPSTIPSKDACDLIAHTWVGLEPGETLTLAVELTEEQIAAGSQGIPESELP